MPDESIFFQYLTSGCSAVFKVDFLNRTHNGKGLYPIKSIIY